MPDDFYVAVYITVNKGNRNPCPCDDYILMERSTKEKYI